ncbi:MAG: serine protease, partial [Rhodospirillales bacterium]
MACATAKLVIGLLVGLLARMDPVLLPLGIDWSVAALPLLERHPVSTGTGFFVNRDGDFLTADHVIGGCRRPAVETPWGVIQATVVARSASQDLAVMRTHRPAPEAGLFPPLRPFPVGEPVTITRYPSCGGLGARSIIGGHATAMRLGASGVLAVSAQQPIVGGNSGSPVIDRHGLLLGMVVAR